MIANLIGERWLALSGTAETLPIYNPATGEVIEQVPLSGSEEAISRANQGALENMAAIFIQNGRSARMFCDCVEDGMVGANVGVAQPFGFYPFSGWCNSFFGDILPHGTDSIEFYTRKKVVISHW